MTPETSPDADPAADAGAPAGPSAGRRLGGWRRSGRRVPTFVWAITALHVALMAMCTVLYPPFTGLDETFHVDMAYAYSQGHGLYAPGERRLARGLEVVYGRLAVPPTAGSYSDTPITPRGQRPSIDAAGGDAPPQAYPVPNQMVQHPPLYYLAGAGVLRLPGVSDLPYDRQVALLRWLSILLVAPLPLLAWATVRRLLGADGPAPLLAAVIPVTMPGLSRLGGSVNNDNLLILLTAALVFVLAGVLRGDLRPRTGALAGLLLGLALLTKGFALTLPVFVAAAYGVAWLRHRRRPLVPLALAAAVSAAVGGWWWVRNLVAYGAVQPDGVGPRWLRFLEGPPRPGRTWVEFVPEFARRFSSRFWGGLGYPDAPTFPAVVTAGWLGLLIVGVALGVGFGIRGRWGRAAAAALVLPALGCLALIFYNAGTSYLYNGRLPGIQGRYVYPGLTALAALCALGFTRVAGRAARVLPLLVLGAGLLTQAWAWRLLVAAWWVPRGTVREPGAMARGALAGILRWSPWPPWMTIAPFVAVVGLSVLALVVAAYAVRHPAPAPITPAEPAVTDADRDRPAEPATGGPPDGAGGAQPLESALPPGPTPAQRS